MGEINSTGSRGIVKRQTILELSGVTQSMGPHVKTSREVQGLVTRVRPGVTRHAPHLPDIVLSVMGLVKVQQVLVEGSVDMAMDQDVGIMGDLMAITEDLVATTEDLITTTEDLVETTEDLVETTEDLVATTEDLVATMEDLVVTTEDLGATTEDLEETMGASIMGAVFPTADMDRIVILATTANTTMVSSLGPWPVSSMEGRHQRKRIV